MATLGRNINYAGGFEPENTKVAWSGVSGGGIVRQIQLQYQREVSRIWDLGTGSVYLIAGIPNGNFMFGMVAAGVKPPNYGVCNPGTVTLAIAQSICRAGGGNPAQSSNYTLNHVVSGSVAVSGDSSDMMIVQGVGGTFLSLS